MKIDPTTPEGAIFSEQYKAIASTGAVAIGTTIAVVKSISCFVPKDDDFHCITPGAAETILAEIRKELNAKKAPQVDVPAPAPAAAAASASASSSVSDPLPADADTSARVAAFAAKFFEEKAN